MIELTNSTNQVLAPGQSATFDTVILHTGCSEYHQNNSGSVSLIRGRSIYEISFGANIGGTAPGDAQIGITLNGSPLNETKANSVTASAGDLNNVSRSTYVQTCYCGIPNVILLTNTGTTEINLGDYPTLKVRRIAPS